MTTKYAHLADGAVIPLGPNELVPEGAVLRTSVLLRDEDSGAAERERRKIKIANTWRGPNAPPLEPLATTPEEAYQRMKRRLRDAWKVPPSSRRP